MPYSNERSCHEIPVLNIIEHSPEKLTKVPGVGPKRIEQITKGWIEQKEIATVMIFLQEKGASSSYASKIYKQYGSAAISIMTENPYKIAQEVWGIGFKTADAIAQNLGFTKESIKRIKAGILFTISQETGNGHLYVELEHLKKETAHLLELSLVSIKETVTNALHELYQEKLITLLTYNEKHYITLPQYYWTEKNVAQKITALLNYTFKTFETSDVYKLLQIKKAHEVELNELQQEGILRFFDNKVSIVTGGPGTGKTTLATELGIKLFLLGKYHKKKRSLLTSLFGTEIFTPGIDDIFINSQIKIPKKWFYVLEDFNKDNFANGGVGRPDRIWNAKQKCFNESMFHIAVENVNYKN